MSWTPLESPWWDWALPCFISCHELLFMSKPSVSSIKHLCREVLDSVSAGRPICFLCLSSSADMTHFTPISNQVIGKATTASTRLGFCLYNSKQSRTKYTCNTDFYTIRKERLASRRAGSNAMSAVHLNQPPFGSNALLKMACEPGKWAQCHSNRWAGGSGSQETAHVCQVRVLRAGFPAGNIHMAIQSKLALWQRNAPLLIQLRAGLSWKEKEELLSRLWTRDGRVAGTEEGLFLHFLMSFAGTPTWKTMFWPDKIGNTGARVFNCGRALLILFNIHTWK